MQSKDDVSSFFFWQLQILTLSVQIISDKLDFVIETEEIHTDMYLSFTKTFK